MENLLSAKVMLFFENRSLCLYSLYQQRKIALFLKVFCDGFAVFGCIYCEKQLTLREV